MRKEIFISVFTLFFFNGLLYAQHVTRKGMKPVTKGNAVSARPALYKIDRLNGKWQEVKRADKKNTELPFTDTLLITVKDSKGSVKDDVSMNMDMQGMAAIEAPATLEIAGDEYTIKNLTVIY